MNYLEKQKTLIELFNNQKKMLNEVENIAFKYKEEDFVTKELSEKLYDFSQLNSSTLNGLISRDKFNKEFKEKEIVLKNTYDIYKEIIKINLESPLINELSFYITDSIISLEKNNNSLIKEFLTILFDTNNKNYLYSSNIVVNNYIKNNNITKISDLNKEEKHNLLKIYRQEIIKEKSTYLTNILEIQNLLKNNNIDNFLINIYNENIKIEDLITLYNKDYNKYIKNINIFKINKEIAQFYLPQVFKYLMFNKEETPTLSENLLYLNYSLINSFYISSEGVIKSYKILEKLNKNTNNEEEIKKSYDYIKNYNLFHERIQFFTLYIILLRYDIAQKNKEIEICNEIENSIINIFKTTNKKNILIENSKRLTINKNIKEEIKILNKNIENLFVNGSTDLYKLLYINNDLYKKIRNTKITKKMLDFKETKENIFINNSADLLFQKKYKNDFEKMILSIISNFNYNSKHSIDGVNLFGSYEKNLYNKYTINFDNYKKMIEFLKINNNIENLDINKNNNEIKLIEKAKVIENLEDLLKYPKISEKILNSLPMFVKINTYEDLKFILENYKENNLRNLLCCCQINKDLLKEVDKMFIILKESENIVAFKEFYFRFYSYSKKFTNHYINNILKIKEDSYNDNIQGFKNILPEPIYKLLFSAGIEKNCLAYLKQYFEVKSLNISMSGAPDKIEIKGYLINNKLEEENKVKIDDFSFKQTKNNKKFKL